MVNSSIVGNKKRYKEYSVNYSNRNISPVVQENYKRLVDTYLSTPDARVEFEGKQFGFKRCCYRVDDGLLYFTRCTSKFFIAYYDKALNTYVFENKNKLLIYTNIRNLLRQQRSTDTKVLMFSDEYKFDEFCRKYTQEQRTEFIKHILTTQIASTNWGDVYDVQ